MEKRARHQSIFLHNHHIIIISDRYVSVENTKFSMVKSVLQTYLIDTLPGSGQDSKMAHSGTMV